MPNRFVQILSKINHQSLVSLPSLLSYIPVLSSIFLHWNLSSLLLNTFHFVNIFQWRPIHKCNQKTLNLPSSGANIHLTLISNSSVPGYDHDVFAADSQPPTLAATCWMYCSWTDPSLWKISSQRIWFTLAIWDFAFGTSQVWQIIPPIIGTIHNTGQLWYWGEDINAYDICFPLLHLQLESFHSEVYLEYSRFAGKRICLSRALNILGE